MVPVLSHFLLYHEDRNLKVTDFIYKDLLNYNKDMGVLEIQSSQA